MTTEPSPGPWRATYEDCAYAVYDAEGYDIAMVACYPEEVEEANAHLIAAARELLEALEYVCAEINNRSSHRALQRAARLGETIIDKAKTAQKTGE